MSVKGTGEFAKGLWNTIIRFDLEYEYASGVKLHYKIDRPYVRIEGTDGWLQAEYGKKLTASSQKILDSGLIAIKLARSLKWDPVREKFQEDNAANAMLTRPVREPWII